MNIEAISARMKDAKKVHFVGVGGISMSSLAMITMQNGYSVSGSDRTRSELTDRLAEAGIDVLYSHDGANVEGASLVVYTAAVSSDNPELVRASELNIPCASRADYLGWLMCAYENRTGVAGTHGKSTVTSMISEIYICAELDPTVVSGAELSDMGGAYRIGGNEHFIFEACEYCDSFLSFRPSIAVITNIEYDHADYFKDMTQLRTSFKKYLDLAGVGVFNLDDPESRSIADTYRKCKISYAIYGDADVVPKNVKYLNGCADFELNYKGKELCKVKLNVPGEHNLYDALAASAAAIAGGVAPEAIRCGLERFYGAKRRFEYMGRGVKGAAIYNDYAHHPSEIKAALAAAKSFGKRVVAVFQPHTYSRTVSLFDDFASCFGEADVVLLADIYAARESNIYGISSKDLADRIDSGIYMGDFERIVGYLNEAQSEDDIILIVGAGDIVKIGKDLVFEK